MKRTALAGAIAMFVLGLAACGGDGGGGGDGDAFCNDLRDLSERVAEGALEDPDDLRDTVNSLLESAPDANLQGVRDVEASLNAGDEGEELQDAIDDAFRGAARDCDIDDFNQAPDEPPTTEEPEDPTTTEPEDPTTSEPDDTTSTSSGTVTPAEGSENVDVGARDPVPAEIVDETFLELANECFRGLARACDDLFTQTPVNSVDEDYGRTCAGRITSEQGQQFDCVDLLFAPVPVGDDIVNVGDAQACFDGEMTACDRLFNGAEAGSPDRNYGALCGFRVQNTTALCTAIFGDVTDL